MRPIDMVLVLASLGACSDGGGQGTPADAGVDQLGVDAAGPDAGAPCALDIGPEPKAATPAIYTPRWAFEPWISKDISSTSDTYDFVDGFEQREIPVGVVVIDSPWETNYNTFIPNPKRYPDFEKLVKDMHARGVRVVVWVTQMVNASSFDLETGGDSYPGPSPNYEQGKRCGFLVNEGKPYLWWKGGGAGVDFFNPRALAWWHRQQDHVLAMGIDGWKLDFGESYLPLQELDTHAGKVPHQTYSEEYYRDFWAYGVKKRGKDFTTMVRGWDESYQFEGRFHARPEHAPVIWAGDNRRDWVGLADALDHIFRSADAGYVAVGSDIGGYLDFDDVDHAPVAFDQDAFVRWLAVGALNPFMQLHGRANLTPWTVKPRTQETVALYRYWATLHHELVPFWYSLAQEAYKVSGKPGILRPVGAAKDWPDDYRYLLGEALLVAPILDSTGKRDVALPAGAMWYDWWKPSATPLAGGQTLASYDVTDQQRTLPLFVREGAIIPAHVEGDLTGLGSAKSTGHLTVLVYPGSKPATFELHEEDDKVTTISAMLTGVDVAEITLSRATLPLILRVRIEKLGGVIVSSQGSPIPEVGALVELEGKSGAFFHDPNSRLVWIKLPTSAGQVTVKVQ
jgi:alpha-glucosidase (family GH31 glycosyl hydrolase)